MAFILFMIVMDIAIFKTMTRDPFLSFQDYDKYFLVYANIVLLCILDRYWKCLLLIEAISHAVKVVNKM